MQQVQPHPRQAVQVRAAIFEPGEAHLAQPVRQAGAELVPNLGTAEIQELEIAPAVVV